MYLVVYTLVIDKMPITKVCAQLGAALLVIGGVWLAIDFKGQFGNFFHLNVGGLFLLINIMALLHVLFYMPVNM